MRVLSKAFGRLKTTLPWVPADTKLSKLDTLRLATTYIAHLSSLLTTTERSDVADQGETATQVAVTSTQPLNYAMVNLALIILRRTLSEYPSIYVIGIKGRLLNVATGIIVIHKYVYNMCYPSRSASN